MTPPTASNAALAAALTDTVQAQAQLTRDLCYESWADAVDAKTPPSEPSIIVDNDAFPCLLCNHETVSGGLNADGVCHHCEQNPPTCELCKRPAQADDEQSWLGLVSYLGGGDDRIRVCQRCANKSSY
jgi:hypothetical protein